jgi:threonine dehydrogenase-like Zn-dependent dehydrogenase
MTKKVAIVGISGLGMAHACACGRVGYQVVAIVDRNREALDRARNRWVNRFDGLEEETPVQAGCVYAETFSWLLGDTNPDAVILATPPHVFEQLIWQVGSVWPNAVVCCEKPVWLSEQAMEFIGQRLRMSAPYVHLSGLKEALASAGNVTIHSTRPTMTTRWGYRLTMLSDYMPHFGAMLWHHLGRVDRYGWERLEAGVDWFKGDLRWGDRLFHIDARRGEDVPYAWFLDGQRLEWELELFDRQMVVGNFGIEPAGIRAVNDLVGGKEA